MKFSFNYILALVFLMASCSESGTGESDSSTKALAENTKEQPRIITLSGFLTELAFTLEMGDQIVGRDMTSTYPAEAEEIPNLGHVTQLNAEAILQLNPDLILVEEKQLEQAEVLKQLESSGIEIAVIPTSYSFANTQKALEEIGKHIEIDEAVSSTLLETIEADSLRLEEQLVQKEETPSVLFIYARGTGRMMVGGKNNAASAMIEKAGAQSAIQDFEAFLALTPEALIKANPDIILMFESGLESLDGKDGLAQVPGISQTPAYQEDRIITMDGHYLMSFGPRSGKAANDLYDLIHNQ